MLSGFSILLSAPPGDAVSEPPDPELRPLSTWGCGESGGSAVVDGLPNEEGVTSAQAPLDRGEGLWMPTVCSAGCWYVSGSHGDLCSSSVLSVRRLLEWDKWPRLVRWLVKGDVHLSLSMGTLMVSHRAVSRGNAPQANCNNNYTEGNSLQFDIKYSLHYLFIYLFLRTFNQWCTACRGGGMHMQSKWRCTWFEVPC